MIRRALEFSKELATELAGRNHPRFVAALPKLLAPPPAATGRLATWRAAIGQRYARYYRRWGFAYYYRRRDSRALELFGTVESAIAAWTARPETDIGMLCELVEFHYLLSWCFADSSTAQCRMVLPGLRMAAAAFARDARAVPSPPAYGEQIRVVWLAMFPTPDDPMSVGLRHVAPALNRFPDRFHLTVIAWNRPDPSFVAWLRSEHATCHVLEAGSRPNTIAAIEALVAAESAAIVVSDMNNAVPTALFARRLAPVQIFLQAGLPAWPVRPLDGVFNSFGFDPIVADWGDARLLTFDAPWDLTQLNPPENPTEIAAQRVFFPVGKRPIGTYCRLSKVTESFLKAAEKILLKCDDAAFVIGGTGDVGPIRAFIAQSPVGDRMHAIEGYVPGHSWDRILDVFLDTWPVTGGESSRAAIAKSRPVVTLHSDEMPAIDRQRDPALVARTWDEYVDITVRLLTDSSAYTTACARAGALAKRFSAADEFAERLATDLESVLDDVRTRCAATLVPDILE
ncbi:MAG: hypothetical protein WCI94_07300 [Rhodospirillales bacterium]